MSDVKTHADASEVSAESGVVLIDGPNGTAVSLTPLAAEETARRLVKAAARARKQDEADAA